MKALLLFLSVALSVQLNAQNWDQIGPFGGYFKEFTFHPTDPSIVYAGSDDGGGIWKSTDGGNFWTLLTQDFPNMTGWSITVDAADPNILYACDVYSRYGLLKSTDAGITWNEITSGLSTQYDRMVSGLAIKTSDTLFISTGEGANTTPPRPGNGVFKSFDAGNSWMPGGLQGETVLSIGNNIFGTIFAGTEGQGLQFTNDNGNSWFPHPEVQAGSVVFEIEVEDSIIAVATSSGVYLSTNWGINFSNTGLFGEFNFDICIVSTSPNIELLCPTFQGLQQYSTANSSWSVVSEPLLLDKLTIGIGASNSNVLAGTFTNGPIYKSINNGLNWSAISGTPNCTEVNDVLLNPNNPNHMLSCLLGTYNIGGSYNDLCISETTNGGLSWLRKGPEAHGLCMTSNPNNFNTQYLGTFSQGLFKSTDSFGSFSQLISGNKLIADVIVSQEDTNTLIISEVDLDLQQVAIKRSIDGGNSFNNVASLATNRLLFNLYSDDTVYAATNNGIQRSIDNGLSWSSWQLNGENILSLAAHGTKIYAGTDAGILHEIVGGNVTDISGPWQTPVQIKSIYRYGDELFVGLNGAEQDTTYDLNGSIWMSTDGGNSWTNITTDLTNTNIYGHNVINSNGQDLIIATYGGGMYKTDDLVLSAYNENSSENSLSIQPNPVKELFAIFSEGLQIEEFILLDTKGRMVLTSKGILSENTNVDASALKPGMYTLQITFENGSIASRTLHKL